MARVAFYPAKGADISDADAAVGDVKSPKTFYSVAEPKKTGIMATVAVAPGSSAYPAGYHAGDGGGLPAIDADLAAGNIKDGVVIFDVTGTFSQTLSEDLVDSAEATEVNAAPTDSVRFKNLNVPTEADLDLATITKTYDASSMAVAVGYVRLNASGASQVKARLYMDGLEEAESGYIPIATTMENTVLVATRALSGEKICKVAVHNYHASTIYFVTSLGGNAGDNIAAIVAVGSIKKT